MNLQLVQVIDRGIAGKERVHLRVIADTNLHNYILLITTYTSPSSISARHRFGLWLSSKIVKAGDELVIYTKTGVASEKPILGGTGTYHFLYWGLANTAFNTPQDCAVLFEVNSWQTSQYGK